MKKKSLLFVVVFVVVVNLLGIVGEKVSALAIDWLEFVANDCSPLVFNIFLNEVGVSNWPGLGLPVTIL